MSDYNPTSKGTKEQGIASLKEVLHMVCQAVEEGRCEEGFVFAFIGNDVVFGGNVREGSMAAGLFDILRIATKMQMGDPIPLHSESAVKPS